MATEAVRPRTRFKVDAAKVNVMAYDQESAVEKARDDLLLRDFGSCYNVCLAGIAAAKPYIDDQSTQLCIERLCVLCIQALAEMDRWQDVLPFVQDVYSSIDQCPATVIQLCILLHDRVKQYSQCHALASIWLRCKDNSTKTDYSKVASLYVVKIMIPRNQYLLISQFLDSCTHLDEESKHRLLRHCEQIHRDSIIRKDAESVVNSSGETNMQTTGTEESGCDTAAADVKGELTLFSYMKYVGCMFMSKISYPTLDVVWKLAAATVGFVILLKITADGYLLDRLGEASILWKSVWNFLKMVFSPYRPGR